jgi:predicted transcriptional regulator
MKTNTIITKLQQLGLTETESRVYISLLALGKCSIVALAKHAGIKRTTLYGTIEQLITRGVAYKIEVGMKSQYSPHPPQSLLSIADAQKSIAESLVPVLEPLMNERETTLSIVTGAPHMQKIYMESLDLPIGSEYLIISHLEPWYSIDPSFSDNYRLAQSKSGLKVRALVQNTTLAKKFSAIQKNYNQSIRLLPEAVSLDVDILLLPDKVIITDLKLPYTVITITNSSVVALHRQQFDLLWNMIP